MQKLFAKGFSLALVIIGMSACSQASSGSSLSSPSQTSLSSDSSSSEMSSYQDSSSTSSSGKEKSMVNENELLRSLKDSPYSDYIECASDFGLSDISEVGVNQEDMKNIKFPVPMEGTVYLAEENGMGIDVSNNGRYLNSLLASLATTPGIKKIVFGIGTYHFTTTINVKSISDLYICGSETGDTNFVFDAWIGAIDIDKCTNVHINNVNIDYDPSPTVAGTVKSCDLANKRIVIDIPCEFDLSDSIYNGGAIRYGSYMEFIYSEAAGTYIPDANGNLLYNSTGDGIKSITGGSYDPSARTLTLTFASMKSVNAGTRVSIAFTMYDYTGIIATTSKNIFFESINIYTTPGMSFRTVEIENMYMNRTNVMLKEGSSRLMTATADIVHCVGNFGALDITNCIFENSHDDALNICTFYKTISSNLTHEIVCTSASYDTNVGMAEGDGIVIYDPKNFALVESFAAGAVTNSGLTYTIEVAKRLSVDYSGFLLGDVTRNPNLNLSNNIIRNKRNRGILAQVRSSSITNNSFENIIHGAVSVFCAYDIFHEGIVPADIEISGNKFFGNNQGYGLNADVAVMSYGSDGTLANTINGIHVANNYFYHSYASAISFLGGGDSVAENNLIDHVAQTPANATYNSAFRVITSDEITIRNNVTILTAAPAGFQNIYLANDASNTINENNVVKEGY